MPEREDRPSGLLDRLFRVALVLYPKSFRARFGERMLEDFTARRRRTRDQEGRFAAVAWGLWALVGLLPSAARVRARSLGSWQGDLTGVSASLRRTPTTTALSVAILCVGVGGASLIFSLVYGTLLRPLPYDGAERTVVVWTLNTRQDQIDGSSYLNMADWEARSRTVEQWAFYVRPNFTDRTLTGDGEPARIQVGAVDARFFRLLGVAPLLGRAFTVQEERSRAPVVVLSHALWSDRFGRDPGVLSKTLELDGQPRRIVGVMPPDLQLPSPGTLAWEPHSLLTGWPDDPGGRRTDAFVALAKLLPGTSVEAARSELAAIAADLRAEFPDDNQDLGVLIRPLLDELTGQELPRTLWLLQSAALLVLLAVAANLGHLWLVRGLSRRQELAVRMALGAPRGRLVRLLFAEGAILTVLGTVSGLALAALLRPPLLRMLSPVLPRSMDVGLQPLVLAATSGAALLVGAFASLSSARLATRVSPGLSVSDPARAVAPRVGRRLRVGFVVIQMALAVSLVLGAGVLLKSLRAVEQVDTGMDLANVLVGRVELPRSRYTDPESRGRFPRDVVARLEEMPGVEAAGAVSDFLFHRFPDASVTPEGGALDDAAGRAPIMADFVVPGYFRAVGTPLTRGRALEDADDVEPGAQRPVVVNEAFARTFWPGQDALGRRFQWGTYREDKAWMVIVGISADARRGGLDRPAIPQAFLIRSDTNWDLTVRVAGDPLAAVPLLRQAVHDVDPAVALSWIAPGATLVDRGLRPWRLRSGVGLLAAGLVVTLALLGMYGLLNEGVLSRRFEIGLRLALGASPRAVGAGVLRQAMAYAALGLAAGVTFTAVVSRALSSFLYGVSPLDPATLLSGAVGLLGVAALVSWLPARHATRIDPARCLSAD